MPSLLAAIVSGMLIVPLAKIGLSEGRWQTQFASAVRKPPAPVGGCN